METLLVINNFDDLDEGSQQEIQDFIAGITTNWQLEYFSHCDVCGVQSELIKRETDGGIIRVCKSCNKKVDRVYNEVMKSD